MLRGRTCLPTTLCACGFGALGLFLVEPALAAPIPFATTTFSTALTFTLSLSGQAIIEAEEDPVSRTNVIPAPPGSARTFWSVNFTVTPDDGAFEDDLEVEGSATHLPIRVRGHNHAVSGDTFEFDLEIDGDDVRDRVFLPDAAHDGHQDRYLATLSGVAAADNDEILSWRFDLTGLHVGGQAVGEPGALVLLCCGLAALAFWRRTSR